MSLCCLALFMTLYLLERVPRPTKGELRWGWQNLLWIRSCHIRSPIPHLRNRLINIGSQYHTQIFTCFRCKKFLIFEISSSATLHCTTRTTYQNTEITLFLPYILRKDKQSAFEIWQGLDHHLVSLGTCVTKLLLLCQL